MPKKTLIIPVVALAAGAVGWTVVSRRRATTPEPADDTDESFARGAETLAAVLERAGRSGYEGEFSPAPDASLVCPACSRTVAATAVERRWQERLEGASDPADMLIVSGLRCPECGALATYTSGYGTNASPEEADIAVALPEPTGELSATV